MIRTWRRNLLTCSLAVLIGLATTQARTEVLTDLGTRRFGHDWPCFLGPTQDGKSTERGILRDWSSGLRVLWQRPLEESYGNCTVSRGRVFQFDRQDGKGVVLCLNSESGVELWRYQYDYTYTDLYGYNSGPRTSPLVDENRVYVYGVAGHLICLDASSGKEIWHVDVNQQYGVVQNFFGVGSNPVIFEDKLLVMVGGSPPESRRVPPGQLNRVVASGSGIVAFDKRTGEEVYRLADDLASYASLKVASHDGRPWCFAFLRSGLTTFDPRNGKPDFTFPWRAEKLESVNASMPVVFGDRVLVSETYGPGSALLKFRTGQPDVIWTDASRRRKKAMMTHWNTAIYHNGYLYGSSGRHAYNAELRCIKADSGEIMWSVPDLSRASLMFVDGHFVCLSEDGTLRLYSANHEKAELISVTVPRDDTRPLLRQPAWSAPVLAHGLLYVRGSDRLVCLELIPGKTN